MIGPIHSMIGMDWGLNGERDGMEMPGSIML